MKKLIWVAWALISLGLLGWLLYTLNVREDKSQFLIGDTSYGHYQIEMACSSCHTEAFGGKEVLQDACINCHGEDLAEAQDSHPMKKFTDPREAHRLEILDARYCVSCHTEHQEEQTHAMGVTLPDDYCYHCHTEVGKERESHKDLPFDSCASAGCHNFHDNRALYESFLVANAHQPWLQSIATLPAPNRASIKASSQVGSDMPAPDMQQLNQHPDIVAQWSASAHAGVSCMGCHQSAQQDDSQWIGKPGVAQCQSCHDAEAKGFTEGKHGMRLSASVTAHLEAITPAHSHLDFKPQSLNTQHGCNSCHAAHDFDTRVAAVESCLNCHNDAHSLAFENSPHGKLWKNAKLNPAHHNESVTCATCHMPRVEAKLSGTEFALLKAKHGDAASEKLISVQHNQNWNLRPNEKMIRPVCMQCHSLEFSIDALADKALIERNFNGKPAVHIESVDWAVKRESPKQ